MGRGLGHFCCFTYLRIMKVDKTLRRGESNISIKNKIKYANYERCYPWFGPYVR